MKPMIIKGRDDMLEFAGEFVRKLEPSASGATVLGLIGDLGAGKTTFTQGVALALGIEEIVTSPTFVIEKIYAVKHSVFNKWRHLIHIDAYRLEKSEKLLHLGWPEIIANQDDLIVVEWADRVADILPRSTRKLYFKFIDEETRELGVA